MQKAKVNDIVDKKTPVTRVRIWKFFTKKGREYPSPCL